jgi:uncharacterized protein (DUF952 family)
MPYSGPVPRLYHITTAHAWAMAQRAGSYGESTRGLSLAEVGFIHCSYAHQVPRVADALYRGMSGLVLLVIDPGRLTAELRDEARDGPGERFPHVYGPLNLDAVVDVLPFEPAEDGRFRPPAALEAET